VLLPQGGDGLRRRLSVLEYLSHPVCWISSRHHEKCSHPVCFGIRSFAPTHFDLVLTWIDWSSRCSAPPSCSTSKTPQNVTLSSTLVWMPYLDLSLLIGYYDINWPKLLMYNLAVFKDADLIWKQSLPRLNAICIHASGNNHSFCILSDSYLTEWCFDENRCQICTSNDVSIDNPYCHPFLLVHPPINCFGKVVNFWCLFPPFYFKLFVVMLAICLGLRFLNCSLFQEKNSTLQPKL
jgi:hypothetical protein